MQSKWMSRSPLCGHLAVFYRLPRPARQKVATFAFGRTSTYTYAVKFDVDSCMRFRTQKSRKMKSKGRPREPKGSQNRTKIRKTLGDKIRQKTLKRLIFYLFPFAVWRKSCLKGLIGLLSPSYLNMGPSP